MSFAESYVGKLRTLIGRQLLLLPTGAVIIERPEDGAVLLVRARELPVWGLPGGAQDPGESILETAIREVHEEVGLTVSNLTPFAVLSDPSRHTITYTNGDVCQYCCTMFTTRDYSGDMVLQAEEIDEARWAVPDDLSGMDLGNHALHALELWQAFRETGQFQIG